MNQYSSQSAGARENFRIFREIWDRREQQHRDRKQHIAQINKEARQRLSADRRKEATRARVERHRAALKPICTPQPVDLDRLRCEMQALRLWLAQDGRPQRKLRKRAKEIGAARALYAAHLAATGKAPTHREMAEAMAARTGRAWTVRQGQTALGWLETMEEAGVWERYRISPVRLTGEPSREGVSIESQPVSHEPEDAFGF